MKVNQLSDSELSKLHKGAVDDLKEAVTKAVNAPLAWQRHAWARKRWALALRVARFNQERERRRGDG